MPLTTFPQEILLFTVNGHSLCSALVSGTRILIAVHKNGFRTDYPIVYSPGKIGMDNPEWFSKRFIDRVKKYSLTNHP